MRNENVYLKPNVLIEPLFNQWYAWSCLISPASAAMFTLNSHLRIMKSFVEAPQLHINALRNPRMRGGPFINYDAVRIPDVTLLIEQTMKEQAHLLELAYAIQTLNTLLDTEGTGTSLEPLYEKVPAPLRGYVELVYDLNHRPCIRFIEALLYKSRYFNSAAQSVSLSLLGQDERPFALSTPSLGDASRLRVPLPFKAEGLDELFKMKATPQSYGYIKDVLQVADSEDDLFSSFFTSEVPPPTTSFTGAGLRVRYFGHACVLIESRDVSILTDPVISYSYQSSLYRYTYSHLPEKIDYLLITHAHQDHCMLETLLQLRHKIGQILVPKNNGGGLADPSLKLVLENIGFRNVKELDEMESVSIENGSLLGLPFLGEHADLNIRTKLAYLIELQGKTVLCAADSNNLEPALYDHIHRIVGDIDIIFLGMECDGGPLSWLYGPLLMKPLTRRFDQSRRLNGSDCERGFSIIERFNPSKVYVYAMGQEPWLTHLTSIQYTDESRPIVESNLLVQRCRARGIDSERLYGHKQII